MANSDVDIKIAEEDIVTYKCLAPSTEEEGAFFPPPFGKRITIGETYAIHGLNYNDHYREYIDTSNLLISSPSLDATIKNMEFWHGELVIVTCIIPKNTEYYTFIDRLGDKSYSSKSLKFVKIFNT